MCFKELVACSFEPLLLQNQQCRFYNLFMRILRILANNPALYKFIPNAVFFETPVHLKDSEGCGFSCIVEIRDLLR